MGCYKKAQQFNSSEYAYTLILRILVIYAANSLLSTITVSTNAEGKGRGENAGRRNKSLKIVLGDIY